MFGWYWLADACQAAGIHFVLAHASTSRQISRWQKQERPGGLWKKSPTSCAPTLIPPRLRLSRCQTAAARALRQRLLYVWNRSRSCPHSVPSTRPQPAHHPPDPLQREPWEKHLLASEPDPVRQLALQNDLALIGHYDAQLASLEKELLQLTKQTAGRDFTLLKTTPGIGDYLGLTILHEIGDIARFPSVKDFLSYCRLVKGTVASAGKIKGLRGAKLGNPYLRWAFGEAAIIAKRDALLGPLAQRLEARLGNKFKANTVLAIKLARAVYFMLKTKTVFDPERLVAALSNN